LWDLSGKNFMNQTLQRSLLFRQNVNRTEKEWVNFFDGYRKALIEFDMKKLGETADAESFVAEARRLKDAINAKYYRGDLALRMLLRTERSGSAFLVGKSSTLWEDFVNGLSKAHVMLSDFAAWSQNHIAGIEPVELGFRRFSVAPHPVSPLTWARGETLSPYGRIVSHWRIEKGAFLLDVDVPPGIMAEVVLPDGASHMVGSGLHSFRL